MQEPILNEKEREAVHKTRDAAQADIIVRREQIQEVADKLMEKVPDEDRMAYVVRQEMENVLAKGTEQDKAMILARVPYICQDIKSINAALERLEEKLLYVPLIQKIVFGLVTMVLVGALGAVLAMIFR